MAAEGVGGVSEPREYLLRVRNDRLDLGYLKGDQLRVRETTTAEPGEIVVTRDTDGAIHLERNDGTRTVMGLVVEMNRRV